MKSLKKFSGLNKCKNLLIVVLIILNISLIVKHNLTIKGEINSFSSENQELISINRHLENEIKRLSIKIENLYKYKKIYDVLTNIDTRTDTIYYDIPLTAYQQEFVQAVSEDNGFDETFIYGIMECESHFDVNAASTSSYGIMQINGDFAHFYAELAGLQGYDLFSFEDNVRMGIACLRYIRNYYISIGIDSQEELNKLTLLAYNKGISGAKKHVEKHGGIISKYSDIVLRNKIRIEGK